MTRTLTTKIDGYSVELQLYPEGYEPRTDCFISYGRNARYTASLSAAMHQGVLSDHSTGTEREIDGQTLEAIEEWALENGY